jgi:hypothetical protein
MQIAGESSAKSSNHRRLAVGATNKQRSTIAMTVLKFIAAIFMSGFVNHFRSGGERALRAKRCDHRN